MFAASADVEVRISFHHNTMIPLSLLVHHVIFYVLCEHNMYPDLDKSVNRPQTYPRVGFFTRDASGY